MSTSTIEIARDGVSRIVINGSNFGQIAIGSANVTQSVTIRGGRITARQTVTQGPRRILVTGSRDWTDEGLIRTTLAGWWRLQGSPSDVELVQGECPYGGADEIAADCWRSLGLPVLGVLMRPRDCDADCRHKTPARLGRCPRRGPERNQRMVDLGGYLHAFAFPLPGSKGTVDCIGRIKAAGIPLTVVNPSAVAAGGGHA
ncbi:SLOG family protein [Nocardia vinacea]|uniref:SLOG family protein n=1 Tax=Nocardia vinacea TaxID=96468 RepID=UPI00340F12DF